MRCDWRNPTKNGVEVTHFSDVVFHVLEQRGFGARRAGDVVTDGMTVANVNAVLDELAHDAASHLYSHYRFGGGGPKADAAAAPRDGTATAGPSLSHSGGADAKANRQTIWVTVLRRLSAIEHKWLVRIIMKDMRMHLMHQSILAAFHPHALELLNASNDLVLVCRRCTDPKAIFSLVNGGASVGATGDLRTGIFLHQPLKPMLASVVETSKLTALLQEEHGEHRLLTEPKYDGERMMIHVSRTGIDEAGATASAAMKITYWTRNAKNFTAQYAPRFDPVIQQCLAKGTNNVILDGEFLVYDAARKTFKPFGSNRTFATSGVEFADIDGVQTWFCYWCFDVVFLDGQPLVTTPLHRRKDLLEKVLSPKPTMLELVPYSYIAAGATADHTATSSSSSGGVGGGGPGAPRPRGIAAVLEALDRSLAAGYEGVMIKAAASPYVPGERRLKWMKLKPDHIAGMSDTLDLIILGGYYGTKFGTRNISHFLLATWVPDIELRAGPRDATAKFLTLTKVGTGYTEDDLRDLHGALSDKWITWPKGSVPPWLTPWRPAADDVPDVWLRPCDALVMEVFGYSFTETTKFSTGYTLRFPRCRRLRYDKTIEDATDWSQVQAIMQGAAKQLRKAAQLDQLIMAKSERAEKRRKEREAMLRGGGLGTVDGVGRRQMFFKSEQSDRLVKRSRSVDDDEGDRSDDEHDDRGGTRRDAAGGERTVKHEWVQTAASGDRKVLLKPEEKFSAPATDGTHLGRRPAGGGGAERRFLELERAFFTTEFDALSTGGIGPLKSERVVRGPEGNVPTTLLFAGFEMCVMGTAATDPIPKRQVEHLVVEHGGTVVAHPQPDTTAVILSSTVKSARVGNWIRACRQATRRGESGAPQPHVTTDVIKTSWVMDCVERGSLVPLAPRYMLYTSPATAEAFKATMDRFADSYYDDATPESMQESIAAAVAEVNTVAIADGADHRGAPSQLEGGDEATDASSSCGEDERELRNRLRELCGYRGHGLQECVQRR